MEHLSIENLQQISDLILTPLTQRMDTIEDTLHEMKEIIKKQSFIELELQRQENNRMLCSSKCEARLNSLEKKPEKGRETFKFWSYVVVTVLGVLITLNSLGIINIPKNTTQVQGKTK